MERESQQQLKAALRSRVFNTSKYNSDGFLLNVYLLPKLLKYILTHLTPQEQKSMVAYEAQNLLLEISAKGLEGHKLSTLEDLVDHVIEEMRGRANYWERYSNSWHRIQKLSHPQIIQEEEQKEALAINLYKQEIKLFTQYYPCPQMKEFQLKRQRVIPQNYQQFNYFGESRPQAQRIDPGLLPHLKEFLLQKFPTLDGMMVEYFLLDCCLSSDCRKRRKRNIIVEDFSQSDLDNFRSTLQSKGVEIEDFLENDTRELFILSTILKLAKLLSITPTSANLTQSQQTENNISEAMESILSEGELLLIVEKWSQAFATKLSILESANQKVGNLAEQVIRGCSNSQPEISNALSKWNEMHNCEEMAQINKYKYNPGEKIQWTEDQYRKFLEGLVMYSYLSVNNKKIAAFMGKDVEPNHVKYVKGEYLRNLKIRRGPQSKLSFMKKDLDNFSMKVFDKPKLVKSRRPKKRRSDEELDDDDESYR